MPGESALSIVSEGMFTVPEAVVFSGLSRTALYKLMDSGELIFAKSGSKRRIPRQALREYLATTLRIGAEMRPFNPEG